MSAKFTICLQLLCLLTYGHISSCINLGLISGDLRRTSNPLIIKKNSHHAPVTINIKPAISKLPTLPKLPKLPKIPFITPNKLASTNPLLKAKLKSRVKSALLSKKLRKKPKLPKLPLLTLFPKIPKIPKLPLPPILPPKLPFLPVLHPKLPLLPLLPPIMPLLPILPPKLPSLSKLIKPVRTPLLTKIKLQKALGSELKPVKVPLPKHQRTKKVLEKLVKLKKAGSLTTPEFFRFKKLLL